MNRNVKIAKELVKLAKSLVASDGENEFHYDKSKNEIRITLTDTELGKFVKSPDYRSMQGWFMNAEGGKRDFTKKNGMNTATFALYPNNAESKSHASEIEHILEDLGYNKV